MSQERISIYIDANNFEQSIKTHYGNKFIDHKKLYRKIQNGRIIVTINYYVNELDPNVNPQKYEQQQKRFKRLESIIPKFKVKQYKMKKHKLGDGAVEYKERGIDIEIARDMSNDAKDNLYDTAILIASDSDFQNTIKDDIQALGKRVELCNFKKSKSFVLRSIVDKRIILDDDYLKGCWLGEK